MSDLLDDVLNQIGGEDEEKPGKKPEDKGTDGAGDDSQGSGADSQASDSDRADSGRRIHNYNPAFEKRFGKRKSG